MYRIHTADTSSLPFRSPALAVACLVLACGNPPLDESPTEASGPAPTSMPRPRDGIHWDTAAEEEESQAQGEAGAEEAADAPQGVDDRDVLPDAPAEANASPCTLDTDVPTTPSNVEQLIEVLNAMPRPATIPCFLANLDRPLAMYATRSQFSAQPADSVASPRTFLVIGDLTLSVVPSGPATQFLEFGYRVDDERSVKGEIEFPLTAPLTAQDLVEQIEAGPGSMCGGCHTREAPAEPGHFEGALASSIIEPMPYYEVPVEDLQREATLCDPASEPRRCNMLGALFDYGDVERTALWPAPAAP